MIQDSFIHHSSKTTSSNSNISRDDKTNQEMNDLSANRWR